MVPPSGEMRKFALLSGVCVPQDTKQCFQSDILAEELNYRTGSTNEGNLIVFLVPTQPVSKLPVLNKKHTYQWRSTMKPSFVHAVT